VKIFISLQYNFNTQKFVIFIIIIIFMVAVVLVAVVVVAVVVVIVLVVVAVILPKIQYLIILKSQKSTFFKRHEISQSFGVDGIHGGVSKGWLSIHTWCCSKGLLHYSYKGDTRTAQHPVLFSCKFKTIW